MVKWRIRIEKQAGSAMIVVLIKKMSLNGMLKVQEKLIGNLSFPKDNIQVLAALLKKRLNKWKQVKS
jgi:hypothetical protein